MVAVLIVLGAIAVAGPARKREQPLFTEDKASLVLALDLSETMNAIDLDPTRLERVKLKLRNLLKVRNGGRTALFVYAGTVGWLAFSATCISRTCCISRATTTNRKRIFSQTSECL
jgi:hypothetical protein